MRATSKRVACLVVQTLRNPRLYAVAAMLSIIAVAYYGDVFADTWLLQNIESVLGLGLTRQTVWRILFLVPICYASLALGAGGGVSTLAVAAAMMLPRALLVSASPRDATFETVGVILVGGLIVWSLALSQREKQRLADLESTQKMLNLQIRRLSILHVISGMVSQSLETQKVLEATIARIGQIMDIQMAWLYLRDDDSGRLRLAACNGLSEQGRLDAAALAAELDGSIDVFRDSVVVEDTRTTPFQSALVATESIASVLTVPLLFKNLTLGLLCVGARVRHPFPADEVDLLKAVGDRVCMAVENARLYEKERRTARALAASERNYREIFENAGDAMWIHDLHGTVLAGNPALARLTGRNMTDLVGADVTLFLPDHGVSGEDRHVHDTVLRGEQAHVYEQRLVRQDGTEAVVQIGTTLTTRNEGDPWAFQHIARDITEQRRNQDNLRAYIRKVGEAQEAERKRIARELHDETAQALVVVTRHLEDIETGKSRLSIHEVREQVRKILEGVRRFSQELRPPMLDDLGLVAAVQWLASESSRNYGVQVDTEVKGKVRQLGPDAELMLFRVVQEALNNVRRHSGAARAWVVVEFAEKNVKVTISDNGKGFAVPQRVGDLARSGRLGLAGMHERVELLGGTIEVQSEPGKGTNLMVEVPL